MDGRVQVPVIRYLQNALNVEYVDSVTEPGPVQYLATNEPSAVKDSILSRVDISICKHASKSIAIVAHADCAGNPIPDNVQKEQLKKAIAFLCQKYPAQKILGLWVDLEMKVEHLY
jgi:hypothetical protein